MNEEKTFCYCTDCKKNTIQHIFNGLTQVKLLPVRKKICGCGKSTYISW